MASVQRAYKRNYDSSDATHFDSFSSTLLTPEECGFTAPTGKIFKEWNTSQDGTGTSYQAGSSEPTPETLYAIWESVDISISYAGSQIATMNSSGTKTLLTEGKYCEDDIVVQYTRYSPEVYAGEHHQPAPGLVTVTVVVLNSEYVACDVYNYNNEIGQHLGSIVVPEQSVVVQPETDEIYIRFTGVVMTQLCNISYIGGEATLDNMTLSENTAGFRFSINGDVTIIMSGVR